MASNLPLQGRDYSSDLQTSHPDIPLSELQSDADDSTSAAIRGHSGARTPCLQTGDQHSAMSPLLSLANDEDQQSSPLLARETGVDMALSSQQSVDLQAERLTESPDRVSEDQGAMGSLSSQALTRESRSSVDHASVSLAEDLREDEEPLQQDQPCQRSQRSHVSNVPNDGGSIILNGNSEPATWLPYTLRTPFLCLLTASTMTLLVIVGVIFEVSMEQDGLGADDGSSILLFGWRFTPSLLAVLYVQLTAMLLDDVKRTECFAQLARQGGASATSTLLRAPGAWWNAIAHSLSKRDGSKRSLLLLSSALLNVLGFLAISPLSPSLLRSTYVVITEEIEFSRVNPGLPLNLTIERDTALRITGRLLQNVTTSAWISDGYTILPFWPSRVASPPLGPSLSHIPQEWQANTLVFNTELECEPLSIVETRDNSGNTVEHWHSDPPPWVGLNKTIILTSDSGCTANLTWLGEGSLWYTLSTFPAWGQTDLWEVSGSSGASFEMALNQSQECGEKESILVTPGTVEFPDRSHFIGHLCDATYYMAYMDVTARISTTSSEVVFDEGEYRKNRSKVLEAFLDASEVQVLFLNISWPDYLAGGHLPSSFGLAAILAALYDSDFDTMAADKNLLSQASKVKQRVFGETIQYSLQEQDAPSESIPGKVTTIQRRIVVTPAIAIALAIAFILSLGLQLVVWVSSNLRVRPLNLAEDPSTAAGIASLVIPHSRTHLGGIAWEEILYNYKHTPGIIHTSDRKERHVLFLRRSFYILNNSEANKKGRKASKSTWIPFALRLPTLAALTVYLCALSAAVIVLNTFSQRSQLYRSAFIYQAHVSIFGTRTIEPLSVIITLLAVSVGLWWSSMDSAFRRLQPYISMAQEPPKQFSNGISLSYQSSYWAWAASKAASRKHWLLLLVTVGTSLSPILTIALSAFFERTKSVYTDSVPAIRGLELRQIPFLGHGHWKWSTSATGDSLAVTIRKLYTDLATNWLTGATLQLTMNGSQPPWSRDGWSFTPLQLNQFENESLVQHAGNSSFNPTTKVTVSTPAIRARIECTQYEDLGNISAWLTEWDLRKTPSWNASRFPPNIKTVYGLGVKSTDGQLDPHFFDTNFLADGSQPECCMNGTDWPPTTSAFGNWSPPLYSMFGMERPFNFTIKWIHGRLARRVKIEYDDSGIPRFDNLSFLEVPSVQALHCTPILEKASASVTVDRISGDVVDFAITEDPVNASEAWEHNNRQDYRLRSDDMNEQDIGPWNVTNSYGVLFMMSLLRSASIFGYTDFSTLSPYTSEPLSDKTFNFKDPTRGLNLDLMSYAMYSQVNNDPKALLDANTMEATAKKTFTTFFQHYVISNVSLETGSWAYQPINYTLPGCLWHYNGTTCKDPIKWPISHTNRTTTAEISTEIEVLQTNAAAVWLSVAILIWLIITTVVIAAFQRKYLKSLKGDVACVADTLALVAGSDKLLQVLQERREGSIEDDDDVIRTKLGWFVDREGQRRWGIEVVDRDDSEDA